MIFYKEIEGRMRYYRKVAIYHIWTDPDWKNLIQIRGILKYQFYKNTEVYSEELMGMIWIIKYLLFHYKNIIKFYGRL